MAKRGTINIRSTILKRLKVLGWRRIDLARALESRMSIQHVYQYLAGKSDMAGENIAELLRVLGLEIAPRRTPEPDSKTAKSKRSKPNQKA